jgi:hypothetical protein
MVLRRNMSWVGVLVVHGIRKLLRRFQACLPPLGPYIRLERSKGTADGRVIMRANAYFSQLGSFTMCITRV